MQTMANYNENAVRFAMANYYKCKKEDGKNFFYFTMAILAITTWQKKTYLFLFYENFTSGFAML